MGADAEVLRNAPPRGGNAGWGPWLDWLDAAIHVEVARLRARYELSLDEFRGIYIGDEQVDRLLRRRSPPFDLSVEEGRRSSLLREACRPAPKRPIGRVAAEFGLGELDVAALVVALAPELDPKYSVLYAYLNDDVTRRRPTIDLLVRLTGQSIDGVQPSSTVFAERLLLAERDASRGWRSSPVLLGEPFREFLTGPPAASVASKGRTDHVEERLLAPGLRLIVLEEAPGGDGLHAAHEIAEARGTALRKATAEDARDGLLRARLRGEALYFAADSLSAIGGGPLDEASRVRLREALDSPVLKLIAVADRTPWRRWLAGEDYESFRVEPLGSQASVELWRASLADGGLSIPEGDVDRIARLFALYPHGIRNAAKQLGRRPRCDLATLTEVCRNQGAADLGLLATRETPRHEWSDLVLPPPTMELLQGFASAVRDRVRVFDDWAFGTASGGRRSLRALLAGSSGTGKTLAASVVAKEVGLELYRIDLSAVVSKYVGETEQNLERVFRAAEGGNAILFFDEADALFGKRSEVKDAHDRFSNIEIAYLLQRMESYDGVLILATNLSKNMDEAFARRIHFEIEFPVPDEADRLRLWELHLPGKAPRHEDIDLRFLSTQFPISGGDIRNVALQAAFLAADEGGPIAMRHLIRAMARQRSKQGKLPSASQFKQYFEWT